MIDCWTKGKRELPAEIRRVYGRFWRVFRVELSKPATELDYQLIWLSWGQDGLRSVDLMIP